MREERWLLHRGYCLGAELINVVVWIKWIQIVSGVVLQRRVVGAAAGWAAALGLWLACAYRLEFGGDGVHAAVWAAGLGWVAANAVLLRELIWAARAVGERRAAPMEAPMETQTVLFAVADRVYGVYFKALGLQE